MKMLIKKLSDKITYILGKAVYSDMPKFNYGNTLIIGTKEFYDKTIEALELVKEKDFVNYERILKNAKEIIYCRNDVSKSCPSMKVFFVEETNLNYGLIWYASCLIYMAVYKMLWRKRAFKHKYSMEKACIEEQVAGLIRMGKKIDNFDAYVNELLKTSKEGRRSYRKRTLENLKQAVKDF